MLITAIAYGTEEQNQLKVTTSDEGVLCVPQPCETWHGAVIDAWLAIPGNVITAWVDPVDYMARLRRDRDTKLNSIYRRVERNQSQKAGEIVPTDNDTKMDEIYAYLQVLRDFPAANPITTKAQYDALTWPEEPA
jgi:hypothetical protein